MTIYAPGPRGVCSLALPPPRCSLSFQPFFFHPLFLSPPWSLKAIIISLQTCWNPTLKLYLEEPYWDEWNSSSTKMSGSRRPTLNFLISEHFQTREEFLCISNIPNSFSPFCDFQPRYVKDVSTDMVHDRISSGEVLGFRFNWCAIWDGLKIFCGTIQALNMKSSVKRVKCDMD